MKKGIVLVALSALLLAVPATAERIYVPALGATAADGSALATQVRAGGRVLANLPAASRAGLIPLDADRALEVSAWAVDREGRDVTELPVFTDQEAYSAGVDVPLDRLERPRALGSLQVGAANLSEQTASCQATFFAQDGRRLAEVPFEVAPLSLARRDALASVKSGRATEVRVTCDQSFYPFGVAADAGGPFIVKGVGPNGSCLQTLTLIKQPNNIFTTQTTAAVFHEATKAAPKGILCVQSLNEIKIAKAIYEWDVTVGPWSSRDKSGVHNLGYFFLDRFRSGTVGNVNILGPNKNLLKVAQNVGMPAGSNTNTKKAFEAQTGATYHNVYTFDAANKTATLVVTQNGTEVSRLTVDTKPGNNQTLIIKPFTQTGLAMVMEFGNYLGQHHPEEASVGWKYAAFRLTLVPK